MKPCPYCGAQYPDAADTCSVDGHKLSEPPNAELGQTAPQAEKACCPACGAEDYSRAVDLRGSFSWPLFFAGGVFAVVFRNAGRRRKLRCNKCNTLFEIRAPLSKMWRTFFWLQVLPTVFVLVLLVVILLHLFFSR